MDPQKRIAEATKVIQRNSQDRKAYYKRGLAYHKIEEEAKAIEDFTRAIDLAPKSHDAYYYRGVAFANLKQTENAIADFDEVIRLAPSFSMAYFNRGVLYDRLGKTEEAIVNYTKVIDLGLCNVPQAYLCRGLSKYFLEDYDGAIADFSEIIDNFNIVEIPGLHYFRGLAYKKKYDFEAAIRDFDHAYSLNIRDPEVLLQRAVARLGAADIERLTKGPIGQRKYFHVIEDCDAILEIGPNLNAEAYATRGIAYSRINEHERALADYKKAIQLNPKDGLAYHHRGCMYREMGKFDLALADLNQSIELGCPSSALHADRGHVWAEKGEHNKAIQDYNEAITKDPQFGMAYYRRAKSYRAIGKTAEADKDLKIAKKYNISKQGLIIPPSVKPSSSTKKILETPPKKEMANKDFLKSIERALDYLKTEPLKNN